MEKDKRDRSVDICKGIGILLVVYGHSSFANEKIVPYIVCHVLLFFIISGYVTNVQKYENISWGGYLLKRAKTLLVPYIFFSGILFVLYTLVTKSINVKYLLGLFYSRFCLYHVVLDGFPDNNICLMGIWNSPMWFLTAMFVSVTLFFLLFCFEGWRTLLLIIYIIFTFILNDIKFLLPWSLDEAPLFALFMYSGYYIRKKRYVLKMTWSISILLFFFYILLINQNGYINTSVRVYGSSVLDVFILGVTAFMIVLFFSKKIERTILGNLLSIFGRNSLCLLCIHIIIFTFFTKVCNYLGLKDYYLDYRLFFLFVQLLLTIVIAIPISIMLRRLLPSFFK